MQSISTSSYNDLNIVNPLNGVNIFNKLLVVENYPINSTAYYILMKDIPANIKKYIAIVTLKITKDITNNISYYLIGEYGSSSDPGTFISANSNQTVDYINCVFASTSHEGIKLRFTAYDSKGNTRSIKSCIGNMIIICYE